MLFWPEISALGVFFNFDNERMRPPKYQSAPPPPPPPPDGIGEGMSFDLIIDGKGVSKHFYFLVKTRVWILAKLDTFIGISFIVISYILGLIIAGDQ